ncbi:hypothetical protein E7T06_05505 [Deinococcus sp. Arct2-2]|uniref:ATP-binding protein n=1 Tax=Deinococcus sp. Arct2-2 TaxID=2568653 RepID=UPI0010A35022|nr:AAA family ATPase [Deinococcus sp. Arct2-2]THF70808.1 hypothetical protein E7T06_05505 [Deinococcus sp. Arct2-2]
MASGLLTARWLGEGRLTLDSATEVHLPTRKALALIAYLSLEGPVPRAQLAGLLWSDFYDDLARKNLRQELHRLTRTPLGEYLSLTPDQVGLRGPLHTDVQQFRALVARGALEEALALYGGPLLDGLDLRGAAEYDHWLSLQREALAAQRLTVLERLLGQRQSAGDLRGALDSAALLMAADDFQERHYRTAMELHLRLGEPGAALRLFERCQVMLRTEFALEPLPETVALSEQARLTPVVPAMPPVPNLEAPLVGRDEVWAQLEQAWRAGRSVVLSGEGGVGKSRLLRDFAASQGRVLVLRGQALDAGVPFATLARTIREVWGQEPALPLPERARHELARLVPELGAPPASPLRSEEDRLRLFSAYVDYLEAVCTRFDVLLGDDLHLFDASSFELHHYALARLRERGLQRPALFSLRRDELRPDAAAHLETLLHAGDTVLIELGPLSESAVADLVARLSGRSAVLFPRRLHAATGGNAFFVLETLRGLFEAGELQAEPAGGWATRYDDSTKDYVELPLPPSVREAVLARANRLGAAVRRLLEVGSLAGEPFALDTVAQVSALSDWEGLEGLETAAEARLLRVSEGGYRFAHELARRALAQAQSPERRRLIHRRLAEQLERSGGAPAVIAAHFGEAQRPAEAAAAWLRAAQDAQAVYANREALAHLGRALAAGALPGFPTSLPSPELFDLHVRREGLARELGERAVQQAALDAMQTLAETAAQRLTVALRRSNFLSIMGRPQDALAAAEQACALAAALGRPAERGEALIRLASALYYTEDFDRALAQATAAAQLEDLSPAQRVQALNLCGLLHTTLSDPEAALADYAAGLATLGLQQDALLRARIFNNRATTLCLYGAYAAALADTTASLALIAQHGFRQLEGFVLDTHARALRGLGRLDEAEAALTSAISLGQQTGNHRLVSSCLHHRVQLLNDQGQFGAALQAADEALTSATTIQSASNRSVTLTARAETWLALGRLPEALSDAQQAALPGLVALREAWPEQAAWVLAQALRASGQEQGAQAVAASARAALHTRLARLHDPELRRAFTALPVWRALFG